MLHKLRTTKHYTSNCSITYQYNVNVVPLYSEDFMS